MSKQTRTEAAVPGHRTLGEKATRDTTIEEEFAEFYRGTVKELVGFLILQGARLGEAADIAHDTLTATYRRWNSIDHPRAWSYRVASRALIRRIASVEDPSDDLPESNPLLRTTEIDIWEQQQDVLNLLRVLPARQRQVMAWTTYGYTPAEIARELNIAPSAVRANLLKARRALVAHIRGKDADQ